MERRAFQTPLGEVWLWGEPEAFGGDKPVVLIVGGAFQAADNVFLEFQPAFPEAGIVFGHLPGNHCPELSEVSVEAYAAAYGHVLRSAFAGRPAVLCGVSTGALVTLAMDAPATQRMVLIEPPLRTAKLWPLIEFFRQKDEPPARRFVEAVFGVFPDRVEDRDYRPLLGRLQVKAWFLLGDVPLMPERPFSEIPSLVDEPERVLIASHPLARIATSAGSGHNIPKLHDRLIEGALNKAIEQLRSLR